MRNLPFKINQQRLVAEFLELVQIDSPSRQERKLADVLTVKLQQLGLEVYEDKAGLQIGSQTGNLLARLPATNPEAAKLIQPVFFSAHMDTVQPGEGIKPQITDGIITSAGDTILGSDDKAGIATILEALRVVQEVNLPHGEIELVFTICEEVGLLGAVHLEYEQLHAKMGYILDSGGPVGTIIVRGPSQVKFDAAIIGKAAHAGVCPEAGISAIQIAAKAINQMQLGRIDAETTANIGVIEGGKATNIIPDLVNLQGEVRSQEPAKLAAQVKQMQDALEQAAADAAAQVKIQVEELYPRILLSPDTQVVQLAKQAAANIGLTVSLEATGGGSDANIFNGKGLAAANLGLGMTQVHTTDESVAIADLVRVAEFLVELIKTIALR